LERAVCCRFGMGRGGSKSVLVLAKNHSRVRIYKKEPHALVSGGSRSATEGCQKCSGR
jgi:hypothetical protein